MNFSWQISLGQIEAPLSVLVFFFFAVAARMWTSNCWNNERMWLFDRCGGETCGVMAGSNTASLTGSTNQEWKTSTNLRRKTCISKYATHHTGDANSNTKCPRFSVPCPPDYSHLCPQASNNNISPYRLILEHVSWSNYETRPNNEKEKRIF